MEQVLSRPNLQAALKRVRKNKGSPGIDGMSVEELGPHLVTEWPDIKAVLLDGTYRPSPVKRQLIPKPGGGQRELGIPTVLDRFIQQALLQVLQPIFDPGFSEYSFGFRPGRCAHDAVQTAQGYVQSGRRIVVDVDLEKFFDRVNHDILMDRLSRKIGDRSVLRLIRHYLEAGIMANGVVMERHEGTPQGGPLSPLLANILLDEVDKELERRGHLFARYADDLNVYVGSKRAGERVMRLLLELFGRLRLKVNASKSGVEPVTKRQFLGFSFWFSAGKAARRRIAPKSLKRFKQRVRWLTRRNCGKSMEQVADGLRSYLLGWLGYYRLSETPKVFRDLDKWIRHRLRQIQLKQWKRGKTMYRELIARGASKEDALYVAANSRRWWRNSAMRLNRALPISWSDQLGVPRLAA
jgi:group II intron reverse transcriptase/maturase